MTGCAVALNMNGVVGQTFITIACGDSPRQHRANRAITITYRYDEGHFFTAFDRRLATLNQFVIKRRLKAVVLRFELTAWTVVGGLVKHTTEIQAVGLPVLDARAGIEQIDTADQFVERANAQLSHDFANLFGHKKEVVHNVFWLTLKFLT